MRVIEIDLRGTANGEVVVMHGETVDQTTDGTGKVSRMTNEQFKALEAGSLAGTAYTGQWVPTYEEVLEFTKDHGVMLLLDNKEFDVWDWEQIVRLTEKHDAVLNVIVGVRSLNDFAEFSALNPNSRTLSFTPDPTAIDAFADAGVENIRLWPRWIKGKDSEKRGPSPAQLCRRLKLSCRARACS